MMLVVSDSSPLNFLIRMKKAELLEQLFGQVVIPVAVREELSRAETPPEVRAFVSAPPSWLTCRSASRVEQSAKLDPGEAEAISLAVELRADLILLDDGDARKAASVRGLAVIGL